MVQKNSFLPSKENCNIENIISKDIYTPILKDKEDFFNNEDYNQEKYFSLSKSRRRTRNENDNDGHICPETSKHIEYADEEDIKIKKGNLFLFI